ncbi:MAG: hypothetical protein HYR72_26285 [Deltaproteobacteria bacterium]|nr:hypothetical protein [Deltaproteobacteria bacterium]MBI3391408.1 hypothetical protein [Deltaproteobacteria bacterium]
MSDQARLSWALGISLLVHLMLLALLPLLRRMELPVITPPSIDVDLTQLAPRPPAAKAPASQAKPAPAAPDAPAPPPPPVLLPERQIVSPPDAGEERPPDKTRLLSDRDNTVKDEMLKRGQAAPGSGEAAAQHEAPPQDRPAPPPPPKPAAKAREQVASLPKLDQLLPRAGDLIREGRVQSSSEEKPTPTSRNLLAAGQGGAFSARPGISDYLPTIREGDLTLLNTKAERFAPFVRRVAARVFQNLEIRLKQSRRSGASGSGREYAAVEAVMSKKGQLVSARVLERESNTSLAAYRELLGLAEPTIFFDSNPPPGAEASDGNIHFILVIDLMVQTYVDQRTGVPSLGYQGMAGVGLDTEPGKN